MLEGLASAFPGVATNDVQKAWCRLSLKKVAGEVGRVVVGPCHTFQMYPYRVDFVVRTLIGHGNALDLRICTDWTGIVSHVDRVESAVV